MQKAVDFIQLETVDSTNSWAKNHALSFNPDHLTCITAQEQTGGRGRQERKWVSPKGNLYVSFYFTLPKIASYLANLGQIMALACAETLLAMKVPVQLKWPNDLLVQDKKIGGVLSETISLEQNIGVILGLGLNVNMPESLLEAVGQPATSLHLFLQKEIESLSLLQPLLDHFFSYLTQLQSFGFASLQPRFQALLARIGQVITVQLPLKKVEGICHSITAEGYLKLALPSGEFLTIAVGDILQ
jgi:BirA family biotin operon repressor/biotin-[acetyl-CoA-carboxylase] ligase